MTAQYSFRMSVEEIKRSIASLSEPEQSEVIAFLLSIRHASDLAHQQSLSAILADRDPSHWLTLEEFERRLDQE